MNLSIYEGNVPVIDFIPSAEIGGGESFITGFGGGFQFYGDEETRFCLMLGRLAACEVADDGFLDFIE